eukprot:953993-Prymnesium_polylepis.1
MLPRAGHFIPSFIPARRREGRPHSGCCSLAVRLMEQCAAKLGVPPDRLPAFAEVYAAQGERGARNWEALLRKVRSAVEVEARIGQRPELLAKATDERTLARARERLIFCGRYSAKAGTPLDDALTAAAQGLSDAAELAAAGGKLPMVVGAGTFADEHARCRADAFPYKPSVSASHGSRVIEARLAEDVIGSALPAGTLLGYVAVSYTHLRAHETLMNL